MLCLSAIPANTVKASTTQPKREMRAVWISTVLNLDMKAGMNKEQYTVWARQTLDQLKANKFNTVIYQVRPTNDAMYASELAPMVVLHNREKTRYKPRLRSSYDTSRGVT
ncbi:family 10 glycosylhydrolase [Lysinibacillus sp. MHQ-1]|nr:family 10 glycosylhydrolase [Lysinibacillus sp. MHQ-1]